MFDNKTIKRNHYLQNRVSALLIVHEPPRNCFQKIKMDRENGATDVSKGVDEVFENNHHVVDCDTKVERSEGDALGKPGYNHMFHLYILI